MNKGNKSWSSKRYITYAEIALLKSRNPAKTLSEIRQQLPVSLFPAILDWIRESRIPHLRSLNNPFPSQPQEWKSSPSLASIEPKNEFRWCCAYLLPYLIKIKEFLMRAQAYEQAFLLSAKDDCISILDSIKNDFGFSLWLLKKKIVLLQIFDGLEAQKKYVGEIEKDANYVSKVIPYFAYYLSYRSEITVSPDRFEREYLNSLVNSELPLGLKGYLCHHLIPSYILDIDIIGEILGYEFPGSAIDYYETFVAMAQMIVAGRHEEIFPVILKICEEFNNVVNDVRLTRICYELGRDVYERIAPSEIDNQMYELFLCGKYSLSLEKGLPAINERKINPGMLQLFSLCQLDPSYPKDKNSKNNLKLDIVESLAGLIKGQETSENSRSKIMRLSWALAGSPISHLCKAILNWESSSAPSMYNVPGIRYHYVSLGCLHPSFLWWNRDVTDSFIASYDLEGCSKTNLAESNPDPEAFLGGLSNDARQWLNLQLALKKEDYGHAVEYARSLLNSEHSFYKRIAIRSIPFCLQRLGKHVEYIQEIVNIYLDDHSAVTILPILEAFDFLHRNPDKKLSCLLSYSILCKIYVLQAGVRYQHLCTYACEDFILGHDIKRPSEARKLLINHNRKQLIFFLREICTEQVMDTWIEFKDSQDVARERIEICRLLTELDSENIESYQNEIKTIIRRITIKTKLHEIEQSKIYIDTASVKNVAMRDLKESYARYQSFLTSGMAKESIDILENTKKVIAEGNIEALLSMAVPDNEMTALLISIIKQLRDEYVSSSQHGLDGYLSVRIRHGTFEGQFRAPLEKENLLTNKDIKTKQRKPNTVWIDRLGMQGNVGTESILKEFNNFSDEFEKLIETIRTEWLQIKKDGGGNGLFDFAIHSVDVNCLSTCLEEKTLFDDFVDKVLDYFLTSKLEPSLKKIRLKLQTEIKVKVNELLIKLQENLEKIIPIDNAWRLRQAITQARTDIQNTLDRIIEWFHLSREAKQEPFSIEDVINISTASIQISCQEFKSEPNLSQDLVDVQGNLASFVDILYLIFENIVRHSGSQSQPIARISAYIKNDYIVIRIENSIEPNFVTRPMITNVERIKTALKEQTYSKSVATEGGSGFFKLRKILSHDFGSPDGERQSKLDFGYIGKKAFYVEIMIPIKILEGEEHE